MFSDPRSLLSEGSNESSKGSTDLGARSFRGDLALFVRRGPSRSSKRQEFSSTRESLEATQLAESLETESTLVEKSRFRQPRDPGAETDRREEKLTVGGEEEPLELFTK